MGNIKAKSKSIDKIIWPNMQDGETKYEDIDRDVNTFKAVPTSCLDILYVNGECIGELHGYSGGHFKALEEHMKSHMSAKIKINRRFETSQTCRKSVYVESIIISD